MDKTENFINRAKEIFPQYDYSKSIYTKAREKLIVICPEHGEFLVSPDNHLNKKSGCPLCKGKRIRNTITQKAANSFIEKAKQIHRDKYDYSKVKYIDAHTKVCITCPEHGEFWQTPNNHLRGQGCPKCREYKGEAQISEFLKAHNIEFQTQYPIEYEGNIKGFTYIDFYLPQHNIFIEYNGMQHYIPVEHFGGELKFQQQKKRDQYVRNYCIENNIQLLEIKYGTNIEDELGKYLGT